MYNFGRAAKILSVKTEVCQQGEVLPLCIVSPILQTTATLGGSLQAKEFNLTIVSLVVIYI